MCYPRGEREKEEAFDVFYFLKIPKNTLFFVFFCLPDFQVTINLGEGDTYSVPTGSGMSLRPYISPPLPRAPCAPTTRHISVIRHTSASSAVGTPRILAYPRRNVNLGSPVASNSNAPAFNLNFPKVSNPFQPTTTTTAVVITSTTTTLTTSTRNIND